MRLRRNKHSCLRVTKYIIFFKHTCHNTETRTFDEVRKHLMKRTIESKRKDSPLPPLNIQIPPSRPSNILFLFNVGLLSVLIHTPAIALSKISFRSSKPNPLLYTRTPPFCPPHILFPRITGLLPVLESNTVWQKVSVNRRTLNTSLLKLGDDSMSSGTAQRQEVFFQHSL